MVLNDNNLAEVLGGLSDRERHSIEAHVRRGLQTAESLRTISRIRALLKRRAKAGRKRDINRPVANGGKTATVRLNVRIAHCLLRNEWLSERVVGRF
jgi:hypothetical protein